MTTYRLSTLRDVFDKVPADRISLCLQEIGAGMVQTKELAAIAEGHGAVVEWPDECEWIDDDSGVITLNVVDDDGNAITIETRAAA